MPVIKRLKEILDEPMTTMKRELTQEGEQADERLVMQMKLEFRKKSCFNQEVKSKFESVKAALQETFLAVEKATTAVESNVRSLSYDLDRQK